MRSGDYLLDMGGFRRPVYVSVLIGIAALGAFALARPGSAAAPGIPPIALEDFELDNGLEVILSRQPGLPIVAVNLWYHVGALHEPPGRSGFAHLFEHMMFQGSAHVAPGQHLAMLERAGATQLNASTDFDRTTYYATVPSNYLETVLWLESDRMGFLLDALDREKLELQRDVVQNERRQRVENAPYGLAEERAWQALFPAPHPYHGKVIGSMADLHAATVGDVREFFRTFYAPANATLTIVGDFDPRWTRTAVEKYFGPLPKAELPPPPVIPAVHLERPRLLREPLRDGTLPLLWMGWHSPGALSGGDAAADLLAIVLATGDASRLQRRLVFELQLAQSVSAVQLSMSEQSVFLIRAIARPGVNPGQLQVAIDAELDEIRAHGIAPEELERARMFVRTSIFSELQTVSGVAERLQFYNHYTGEPNYLSRDLGRYLLVEPPELQVFAQAVLAPPRRVIMHAAPARSVP